MLGNIPPLRALIAEGEGLHLDFKQTISSAKKIAKTVCAFANTQGGKLLIGVKDNGRIVGCEVNEELYMVESAARLYCRPAVTFQRTVHEEKDKWVLEIDIPQSPNRPHQAQDEDGKWLAYVRVEDQTQLASRVVLDLLKHQVREQPSLIEFTETESHLMAALRTQERITLTEAIQLLQLSRREVIDLLVKLIAVGILRVQTTQQEEYYSLAPISPDKPGLNPFFYSR